MEQEQESIFDFGIDQTANYHLISIAKWNKFLSIVNIVLYGLTLLAMIFGGSYFLTTFMNMRSGISDVTSSAAMGGVFTGVLIFYALIIIILLIPNFFRLSSSNKMLRALATQDQQLLNQSLANLKTYGVYWGILTIIGIAIYGLFILLFLFGTLLK